MPENSLRDFLEKATATYHQDLMGNQASAVAVEYLKSRGLSAVSAQYFRLGHVVNPLVGHEKYVGRLAIPYVTRSGVVTIRYRAVGSDDGAKYLSMPNEEPRLFNTRDLDRREPFLCITEGEIDAITAHQAGLPTVGVGGVDAWRPYFRRCFKGYEAVYLFADNDPPKQRPNCSKCDGECKGHRPGVEFAERLEREIPGLHVIEIPGVGQDVNSFVRANGPDALKKLLEV